MKRITADRNKIHGGRNSGRVTCEIKGQEKSGSKDRFLLVAAPRDRRSRLYEDGHTGAGTVQYQKSGKGCHPGDIGCHRMRQKVPAYQAAADDCTEAGVRGNRTGETDDNLPADLLRVQPSGGTDSAHPKYN